ncbi:hypothetical protein AUEXF2481DRAFT_341772 [Aureobasidium subglaciale EXF-2481]|uniref:Secreted protein n=1 Tax=Aureobasidium subglaciale (strain EXF-2481) TaxID=1043005 RepID=A0A074Y6I0_AURSE|nr:uncharacterized protein AUEXF2481DRAFT_341772 [Aureobasidium subglaciale EXF-2481]KAI5199679.1 hypothetical protein E4T38_06934 [Aureobasidium subglaciale]KAI5218485.1 hypothetical protein E4T40_06865 [Aureobasidium subglaciale]KAI5222156.1 hypothetical protein E4T41_06785 [Aureobasidium subglaciale]KAI5259714.1 hypothetical protein E4T46_06763 [Aureobasidium subglaciale]KEQ93383.1 hypothetical protein AUEXF2481DRAFT_341772 [Aureobasidium subglaciale EXF-2481]
MLCSILILILALVVLVKIDPESYESWRLFIIHLEPTCLFSTSILREARSMCCHKTVKFSSWCLAIEGDVGSQDRSVDEKIRKIRNTHPFSSSAPWNTPNLMPTDKHAYRTNTPRVYRKA